MAKRKTITLAKDDAVHEELRSFWRSSRKNKNKVENWVDEKTEFGSVAVFLRSGSTDLFEEIISDLKIENP